MNIFYLIIPFATLASCHTQEPKSESVNNVPRVEFKTDKQIDQYVVDLFQDSKGNLWFGTLDNGVAKYDGQHLTYLTMKDGLPSDRVVSIVEDSAGMYWFGTGAGLSKYDGRMFTNYQLKGGICSEQISQVFIDSKGLMWLGTWQGVCTFDGTHFKDFPLPYPEIETVINPDTRDWMTAITEDAKGNIWLGRDGYGAIRYDGTSVTTFTTKEGLNSNNVQSISEDKNGNIWIGTRVAEKDLPDTSMRHGKGGLNLYNGRSFKHFPEVQGLHENDVYETYTDPENKVWVSTTHNGVYCYTKGEFTHFPVPVSTMRILKDLQGNVWLGCAGGLYRIDPSGKIQNITREGPWK